jgi:NAD(P)-dependent dehydrogenase (short-subunit alcohol dehydrogenase family)
MSNTRSIVMLGSGPGIGVSVASHFAAQGFQKIALVSRNESRLEGEDKAAVLKAAPNAEVKTYAFDLSKYAELPELLSKIEKDSGVPEVIVFNAAHLTKSPVGEYTADEVAFDLQVQSSL